MWSVTVGVGQNEQADTADQKVKLLLDKLHGEDNQTYDKLIKHVSQFFQVTVLEKNPRDSQRLDKNDIFMVIAPNKSWGEAEIETVRKYVESGGIFVALTIDGRKPERLNYLLAPYGLSIIRGNIEEKYLLRNEFENSQLLEGIEYLVLGLGWGWASPRIAVSNEAKVLLQYEDAILGAKRFLGDGTVYLFSCLPVFGNKQLDRLDNRRFLNNLLESLAKTAPAAPLEAIAKDEVLSTQENDKAYNKLITKRGVNTEISGGKEETAHDWFELAVNQTDGKKALEYYSKSLQLEPNNAYAWHTKACMLAKFGNKQEAIECFNRALQLNSGGKVFLGATSALIAGVYYNRREHDQAIEYYDRAIEVDPAIAGVCWHLKGHACWNGNKQGDAIKCFDMALELEPDLERLRLNAIAAAESAAYPRQVISSKALGEYLAKRFNLCYIRRASFIQRALTMTYSKYPNLDSSELLAGLLNALGGTPKAAKQAIELLGNAANIGRGEIPGFRKGVTVTPELNQLAREFALHAAPYFIDEFCGPFGSEQKTFMRVHEATNRKDVTECTIPYIYESVVLNLPCLRQHFYFLLTWGWAFSSGDTMRPALAVNEENFTCSHPNHDVHVSITVPADLARALSIWQMVLW